MVFTPRLGGIEETSHQVLLLTYVNTTQVYLGKPAIKQIAKGVWADHSFGESDF